MVSNYNYMVFCQKSGQIETYFLVRKNTRTPTHNPQNPHFQPINTQNGRQKKCFVSF